MVIGAGWAGARVHDLHLRPRHLADVRVHRPRLLRRDSGRHLRRAARRPVHRPAHAHHAGRHCSRTPSLSHGDTRHPVLFPSSPEECFSMAHEAFDLAEHFQTPVFVMTDLDLGMNNWMADPFAYPEKPIDRGKVLTAEDLERLGGFARYKDVDGDGVPLPHAARHQPSRRRLLHPRHRPQREGRLQRARRRLRQQHGPPRAQVRDDAAGTCRRPRSPRTPGAAIGLICCGTSRYAAERKPRPACRASTASGDQLLCGSRPIPFTPTVEDFIDRHERVYVIEQNRDGAAAQR